MAGSSQAGVIDLGSKMGGANIYTLNNFTGRDSDVEGAVLAGGSVNISGYSVNDKKQAAFGTYAVVAQGDIKLSNGSINNGTMYSGGKITLSSDNKPTRSTVKPIDFEATAAYYESLSVDLAKMGSTGGISKLWDGVKVSGSGKGGVDVFNVSADMFRTSSSWTLDKLVKGQTLIFNVSGASATFNNGGISFVPLEHYNVLFNFPDAAELNIKGMIGSVLAPKATVRGDHDVVNGQVVVRNWDSTIQVNANHYFTATELKGFRDTPVTGQPSQVPEPGTLVLMLAGAGVILAVRRGRPSRATPPLAAAA